MSTSGAKSNNQQTSTRISSSNRLISEKNAKKIVKSLLAGVSKGDLDINTLVSVNTLIKEEGKSKKESEKVEKEFYVFITQNPLTHEMEFHAFEPTNSQNELGTGAQGTVVIAQNIVNGNLVAVKIQRPNGMTFEEDVKRERANLQRAERLIGFAHDKKGNEYTLMEYCRGKNLLYDLYELNSEENKESPAYYKAKKNIEMIKRFHLIYLGLTEIIELHKHSKLAHRDVKTDNFVYLELPYLSKLRLIDLGTAIDPDTNDKMEKLCLKEFMGTFGYIAPEIHQRKAYCYASDLWALGIVFAEILTNENYQSKLKRMSQANAKRSELVHPTSAIIKEMMADVFLSLDLDHKTPKTWLEENVNALEKDSSIEVIEQRLKMFALVLVHWMTKEKTEERPTLRDLEEVHKNFGTCFSDAFMHLKEKEQQSKGHVLIRRSSVYPTLPKLPTTENLQKPSSSAVIEPTIEALEQSKAVTQKVRKRSKSAGEKKQETSSVDKSSSEEKKVALEDSKISKEKKRHRSKSELRKKHNTVETPVKLSSEEELMKDKLCELLAMLSISSPVDKTASSISTPVAVSDNDRIMLALFSHQVSQVSDAIHTPEFGKKIFSLNKAVQRYIVSDKSTIKPQVEKLKETCAKLTPPQ